MLDIIRKFFFGYFFIGKLVVWKGGELVMLEIDR